MSTNDLERAARASRGKRMSKLLNEEAEADDEFWNQEAFKEDAQDNEYEAEDEEADVFDSDFDEDEPDEDDADDEDERSPTRKKKKPERKFVFQDQKKKEKKKSVLVFRETVHPPKVQPTARDIDVPDSAIRLPGLSPQPFPEGGEAVLDQDGERSVRKSTRTAVIIKQAEREAHQAALQALSKPVKKKKEEERKISQEEMLLEAAQTEIQNVHALEIMLAREEEVKRKAIIQKAIYTGPQIRFHSRNGRNVIEFIEVSEFPDVFNSNARPGYPKKVFCVVTGQPAKYRDPKTDLPYATKEAFRIIRERFNKGENPGRKDPLEESHQRKRTKVERERLGSGGRTTISKLKYRKVISMLSTEDLVSGPPPFPEPPTFMDSDVLNNEQSLKPGSDAHEVPSYDPVSVTGKNDLSSLELPRDLLSHQELPFLDMPGAFVEANDTDFMLDDLEVSLPSDLET